VSVARDLHPIPLREVVPLRPGTRVMTMVPGEWNALLAAAYERGWTLVEVDDDDRPVRAYRRAETER
jgi:hypothetical protein